MDYKIHIVSRDVYERTQVGAYFAGGIVIDAIACGLTDKLLLITYHGNEGEPQRVNGLQCRSAPLAIIEAKRRFKDAEHCAAQASFNV